MLVCVGSKVTRWALFLKSGSPFASFSTASKSCGKCHFYPRGVCPHCWSNDLEWIKASGKGKLHTFAIPQRPIMGIPGPFITAIVELAEGPRIATNVVGVEPDPKNLRCDMEVEVVFDDLTDTIALPKFRPVVKQ